MSKDKKDLDKINGFGSDSFNFDDFGDFGDFGFDGEPISTNRSPVDKIRGNFKKGISRKLSDTNFHKQLLKKSLPKEYESGFDLYDNLAYSFRDLNDKVKRELKPGLQELRNLSRKVFPGKIPLVPEKLYEKYNEWLDQKDYVKQSQQSQDEALTAIMLGEVFSNQSKIQEAERREDIVRDEIKNLTDRKRFEVSHIERVRTNSLLATLVNYQDRVTTSYSRRMLELQFKSYLTQVRLLEAVKTTGEKTNKELEAVTKNTALPDFVKMRNTEALKELTRRKLIETALGSTAAGRVTDLGKRLLSNLSKNITNAATGTSFGLETLAGLGSMIDDDKPGPKNFKEVMEAAAEMGAEHGIPFIMEHYAGKGASKLRNFIGSTDNPKSIRHRINRGGALVDYYVNGMDQHLQNKIRHGQDGVLGTILEMAEADKEVFRAKSSLTGFQYGADRFLSGLGSTGTTITTEEIIPNWLQRIWGEIFMLRTGSASYEEEVYDQKYKKFVKVSNSAEGIKSSFKTDYNKSYIDKEISRIILNLTGNKNLSARAKQALANKIRLDAIEGITPTPEKYRYLKDVPEDVAKEIRTAIESNFGYDPIEDVLKSTEGDALNKRRSIFKSSKGLMNQFGGAHGQALRFMDEGKLASLRRLGLIKETKEGLSLDYNKYIEMIDDGFDFNNLDLNSVDPLSPLGPRPGERKSRKGYTKEFKVDDYYLSGDYTPSIFAHKLQAGQYKDSYTGKVIKDLTKLRGDILDENDNIVLTKSQWKKGLFDSNGIKLVIGFDAGYHTSQFFSSGEEPSNRYTQRATTETVRTNSSVFSQMKPHVPNTVMSVATKAKDLYVPGEIAPRVMKVKLEAGEYVDSATGRTIENIAEVKGNLIDRSGNVIVTAKEMAEGLYDAYGNKFIASVADAFKSVDLSKFKFNRITNKASSLKDEAIVLSKKAGIAIDGFKPNITSTDKLLQDIYKLLNHRQPGSPDSHLKTFRSGDLDNDGIRDGSWQDKLKNRGQSAREAINAIKDKTKGINKDDKEGGGLGLLGNLLGLAGKGGKGILGATGSILSGLLGGILGKGVFGAGKFALKAALNPVGAALSAGKWATRGIIKGTGGALKMGARSLPTIARVGGQALLWGSRLAVPLMMNPIGLAVTGAALAAYGGYKYYQYQKKKRQEKESYLTNLRMAHYGIDPTDKEQVEKLLMLEEMREKDFVRPGEERPYKDPETYEEIQRIFFTWGADPANQMHQVRVADWYNNRGGPVMSVWSNALYQLKGYHSLSDIDKLNPTEKEELLKMVRIPPDDPYSAVNFPMVPKDGSEGKALTSDEVESVYQKAVNYAAEEVKAHIKKLEDDRNPEIKKARGFQGRRQKQALAEREAREKARKAKENEGIQRFGIGILRDVPKNPSRNASVGLDSFNHMVGDMLTKDHSKDWVWPMKSGTISSEFGMRRHPKTGVVKDHPGIDIAAPEGTPVYAAANGRIIVKDNLRGYGNAIYIKHTDGKVSRYAHLSAFAEGLEVGSSVLAGQLIGYVGSTGMSTGPHLHFEIRADEARNAVALNPINFINDGFKKEQERIANNKKQDAGKAPDGYGSNEGADMEGLDTIVSTVKPNANPIMDKDVPLMLSRDYANKNKIASQPSLPGMDSMFDKDKASMAFNADMLDLSKEQSEGIGRVGSGIEGMTTEQKEANETLRRIASSLENQSKPQTQRFRRQNQGIKNPTMRQNETLDEMYTLAVKNNLNPADYMTSEQIGRVSSQTKSELPTQLSRTSAIMPH